MTMRKFSFLTVGEGYAQQQWVNPVCQPSCRLKSSWATRRWQIGRRMGTETLLAGNSSGQWGSPGEKLNPTFNGIDSGLPTRLERN